MISVRRKWQCDVCGAVVIGGRRGELAGWIQIKLLGLNSIYKDASIVEDFEVCANPSCRKRMLMMLEDLKNQLQSLANAVGIVESRCPRTVLAPGESARIDAALARIRVVLIDVQGRIGASKRP